VAREFADVNGAALDDPRVRVVLQDGRNYLRTTEERFDVITADPIHPWAAGSSYLYTAEYYRVAASRLAEGGVMCQWLPLYELSEADLRSAVATFHSAFPHVTVWQTALDAVLLGSNRPLRIDPQELQRRLAAPRVAEELASIGLSTPTALLAELALDEAAAAAFGAGAALHTDDNLDLEFSAPLSIGTPRMYDNVRLLDSLRSSPRSLLTGDLPHLAETLQTKSETVQAQLELRLAGDGERGGVARRVRERLRAAQARTPDYGRGWSVLALASLHAAGDEQRAGRPEAALASLREAAEADPFNPDAAHELARALHGAGRVEPALAEYERALRLRPRNASVRHDYGGALLVAGRSREAVEQLRAAAGLRPHSAGARHALGIGLASTGEFEAALQTLRDGLRLSPRDPSLLSTLASFLLSVPEPRLRDPAEALRLAERLTALSTPPPEALELLAAAKAAAGKAP
jgi:Tfp pilus assembly protein PilF